MKKTILILLVFSLIICQFGCSNNEKTIYGTYTFDKIIYLSGLSSSTPDYLAEKKAGTKYIINEDSFEIIYPRVADNNHKRKVNYKREKISKKQTESLVKLFNSYNFSTVSINKYKKKYKYTMYNEYLGETKKMAPYIYTMDDEVWVVNYVDNTADNSDIVMSIYKLK